jgi:hypothetical protein
MQELGSGPGATLLYQCTSCGTHWEENTREMHTLSRDAAAQLYPHIFTTFSFRRIWSNLRRWFSIDPKREILLVDSKEPPYRLLYDRRRQLVLECWLQANEPTLIELTNAQHDAWVKEGPPFIAALHAQIVRDHERKESDRQLRRDAARQRTEERRAEFLRSQRAFDPGITLPVGSTGIETATGALITPDLTITPSLSKSVLLASPLVDRGDWTNERGGWYAAILKPMTIAGESIGVSLMFEAEELDSINLWVNDPKYGTSWDDFTEEKELARDQKHRAWLAATVGEWDSKFKWGSIHCCHDERSDGSTIMLKYRRLRDTAAELADQYRNQELAEDEAQAQLRAWHPRFAEDQYRNAWNDGMSNTR